MVYKESFMQIKLLEFIKDILLEKLNENFMIVR
jgi:hypothetical protein